MRTTPTVKVLDEKRHPDLVLELLISKIEAHRWRRPRELSALSARNLLESARHTIQVLRCHEPDQDARPSDPELAALLSALKDLWVRLERSWVEDRVVNASLRPQTRLQQLPGRTSWSSQ